MPNSRDLMFSGLHQAQANAALGSLNNSLTAAGSASTDCLRVGIAGFHRITTAAASTGIGLPLGHGLMDQVLVRNDGANTVNVYPPVGGTLNGGAANAAATVAAAKAALLVCISADGLTWVSLAGA